MTNIGGQEIIVIGVIGFALLIVSVICALPYWFICKKAGFSPWLSLLILVPTGGLILPFVLAFIDWPSLKKREDPAATQV